MPSPPGLRSREKRVEDRAAGGDDRATGGRALSSEKVFRGQARRDRPPRDVAMASVDRPMTLLDRLREIGLLERSQLDELSLLPEAQDPDPRALGRVVLQRGWLTRFQIT